MATAHLIVSAILRREGRILLVEEIGPGDPGPTWMLPGGLVEAGESVIEALQREVREETGLNIEPRPTLAFAVHVIEPDDQYLALTFACEAEGAVAPDDPDGYILDAAWVEEHEAIARLERVSWYDTRALRRMLADRQRRPDVTVVDRR
jgi:8-oxo-dGTP diphosphatase